MPYSTIRLAGYNPEVPSSSIDHVHGFSPSSRPFFRQILSRLISSWKRSWAFPSGGSPQMMGRSLVATDFPSCRSRWPLTSRGFLGFHPRGLGRLQGVTNHPSTFASPAPVRTFGEAVPLLGFVLLRGLPAENNGKLTPPPLMHFHRMDASRVCPARASEFASFSVVNTSLEVLFPLPRLPATGSFSLAEGRPVWRWLVV